MPIGTKIIDIFKNLPYEAWTNKLIDNYTPGGEGTDFKRFGRSVYRLCAAKAAATQLDCYAFWFGTTIRVQPDGSFGSAGEPLVIPVFWEFINQLQNSGASFYVVKCGVNVDWEKTETIKMGCHFDAYGPKTQTPVTPPGGTEPLSAGMIGWFALAGLARRRKIG